MGLFSKPKQQSVQTKDVEASQKESEETTAKKQRLLETQGGAQGVSLNEKQGQSMRRIFGA